MRRAGRRRLLFTVVAVLVAALVVLLGVGSDVIRLGPSSYPLPEDALDVITIVSLIPGSETHPTSDFYLIRIQVRNHVFDEDVRPYRLFVRADLGNGSPGDFCPATSFSPGAGTCTTIDGITVRGPSGFVSPNSNFATPGAFVEWRVEGESSYGSVPVMWDFAEFAITAIAVPEGQVFRTTVAVTLEWYYVSALQAYPVALQQRTWAHVT